MVKPLSFKGDKKAKKRKRDPKEEHSASGGAAAAQDNAGRKVARTTGPNDDDDDNVENDDSWVSADVVSDVSGPVMFVLPTEPPAALACDANGKVFTLPIENIVEGNPTTAEPHDVRMVWIANRIAGTEHHRFKGSQGK